MNRTLRLTAVLAGALFMALPASAAENWPDSLTDYILDVRETVQTTDMDGYLEAVNNPDGAMLVDVREPEEYAAGHVPGTVNIPRGVLEFRIFKQLGYPETVDMGKTIYVQCLTGGRATLATKQLQEIGFTNAIAVVMDLRKWGEEGHPLTKE